ncbi:MAG: hypothetical protein EXS12_02790 [Phycisphaerales bacterium]|nr:hypothetical protein [Phycisphaerales bacterium]
MARRPRFRTGAAANLLSQVEYAKADVLRRMAMNAQQLARSIDADQLVSESWLIEKVTGVRSRGADITASLVGSAVIDDLAALAIRLTDRAPIDAASAEGGAFTLEQTAKKLGVGVRSIQRWRRLGFISMRFQFGRTCRVGCAGAAIKWFQTRHPELLSKVKRVMPTQHERQQLLACARAVAKGGGTLNAAAVQLARKEKISVTMARTALEQLEKNGSISQLKRRIVLNDSKAGLAWRSWMRGVDLNTIARRVGQTRPAVLRTIAKQRLRRIQECVTQVAPLATFQRTDAAETLLAPMEVRQHLADGEWPTQSRDFLAAFAPVSQSRKNMATTDVMQLTALRFLLWQAERGAFTMVQPDKLASHKKTASPKSASKILASNKSAISNSDKQWVDLDRCETALRWAARLRLSLLQRSVGEALGRLQAIVGAPLVSLHVALMCQAIEIALESACAVLDQCMLAPPIGRPIRLGSLAAAHAEKTVAKHWKFRARAALNERAELSPGLQLQCVPWLRVAPLRDDLSQVVATPSVGGDVLALRYGWKGMTPHTLNDAAKILGIHPRRAAIIAANALRTLVRTSAR